MYDACTFMIVNFLFFKGRVYSNVFSGDSNIVLNILRIMKISDLAFWQMASPFGKWKSAVHYKFCSSSAMYVG